MTESGLDIGSFLRPLPGEAYSGDFVVTVRQPEHTVVALIDIAGHGRRAFSAGRAILARFTELAHDQRCSPTSLLISAHELLAGGPGAAIGIATFGRDRGAFAGVGNIRCQQVRMGENRDTQCTRLQSRDGLVGVRFRTPHEQDLSLSSRDLLILHSDGVGGSLGEWNVREMFIGGAASVARAIVGRYARPSDDASCIVVRHRPTSTGEQAND